MADIADWLLSSEDPYPDPFDHQTPRTYWFPKLIKCRYCQSTAVKWGRYNGKWRLFTGSALHKCSSMPTLKA